MPKQAKRRRSPSSSSSSPSKRRKEKKPKKKKEKRRSSSSRKVRKRKAPSPSSSSTDVVEDSVAELKPEKKPLGDLAQLQKKLQEERDQLHLFVLKAKQEHEEKKDSDSREQRREKEYYKPSFGEPVGPENRFLLEGEIGKGAFATVFRCRDAAKGGEYAVKFIRQNAMLRQATEKEVKLMRQLRTKASELDPEGARCFLGLAGPEVFEHEGHMAVVFQLQRCDLRSGLVKYGQGKGLPLPTIQGYGRNILLALRALRKVKIIHSDVKPDNLLMTMDKASVKLSDFGAAMSVAERVKADYVQPRFYRAPEVILGQAYGTEIDMWSAALTLFELATGQIALTGRTNNDMLLQMLQVFGAFPKAFATAGSFAGKHFSEEGAFKRHEPEELMAMDSFQAPPMVWQRMLEAHIKEPAAGSDATRHALRLQRLAELLTRCAALQPNERLTPDQALDLAFVKAAAPAGQ